MEAAKLNLTLGATQREFLYRKGTVDEAVIVHMLKVNALDFIRLRRGAEVTGLYERLAASGKVPLIVDSSANIGASAVFFNTSFPKARIIALEADAANFQLLTANTAGLPVECIQAALAAISGADASHTVATVTVNDLYERYGQDTVPFIVKLDVEAGNLFAANTEWLERTPVVVATLGDYLIPGTAGSHTFTEHAASWNRDFVYVQDTIFSICREPGLMRAAA